MNNTKLWLKYGLVALAGGVIVFFGLRDFPDSPYLMGLGFGLLGSVAGQVIRTLYWAMPSHREERQRRLKEEKINLADERKINWPRDIPGAFWRFWGKASHGCWDRILWICL